MLYCLWFCHINLGWSNFHNLRIFWQDIFAIARLPYVWHCCQINMSMVVRDANLCVLLLFLFHKQITTHNLGKLLHLDISLSGANFSSGILTGDLAENFLTMFGVVLTTSSNWNFKINALQQSQQVSLIPQVKLTQNRFLVKLESNTYFQLKQ